MISLGSCTMKLNAASEMIPLSWVHWSKMHPFVPEKQAGGYQHIVRELSDYLCDHHCIRCMQFTTEYQERRVNMQV